MRRLVVVAALAAACVPEQGPMMDRGEDCLDCHARGEAPTWTAAGTWEGGGKHVWIQDAIGRSFTIRTNQGGNFYTAEALVYPLTVAIDGEAMPHPVPDPSTPAGFCLDTGRCCAERVCGCNDCHGEGGEGGD
jgi:hypothetical protein